MKKTFQNKQTFFNQSSVTKNKNYRDVYENSLYSFIFYVRKSKFFVCLFEQSNFKQRNYKIFELIVEPIQHSSHFIWMK